jgi:hypothetical protein
MSELETSPTLSLDMDAARGSQTQEIAEAGTKRKLDPDKLFRHFQNTTTNYNNDSDDELSYHVIHGKTTCNIY